MPPKLLALQPVLMVTDVSRSLVFYQALGFEVAFVDSETEPRYAALGRDGLFLFLQGHAPGDWDPEKDRPCYRFVVEDLEGLHREFCAQEAVRNLKPVQDTPWGTREFHLQDPDRNGLQFYHDL